MMTKLGKKLASASLLVVMVIAFMPLIGTQTAYAAPDTDTITKVVLSFPPGYSINQAFKEGDDVEQFEITVKSVESTNGQVNVGDLSFDTSEHYGWCHSYISGSETWWIKYSDDDTQGLQFTDGESRFMADVYVNENVDAVFADDCEFYIYDEPMTLYRKYNEKNLVFYASREATGLTGSIGENANYAIDMESGSLQISGYGPIKDYGNSVLSPLNPYRYYIKSIIIGDGITEIGSCSTSGMYNCTSVTLPDTLETLGWAAFSGYTSLKVITLPATLTTIESYAFDNTGLETINYLGTLEQWQNTNISDRGNDILNTDALIVQGHTHHFVKTKTVPATCGADGYDEYTCDCGSVYQEKTEDATGNHTYNADDVCTVCGAIKPPDPDARSGKCGADVNWSFDEASGVLTISGSGPMKDYGNSIYSPFAPFNYMVKSLIVEEGVTSIGSCSTSGLYYCTSVSLPSTLERLGWAAFSNYGSLKEITLPASLAEIIDHAFSYSVLEKINYMGTKEQWAAITIQPNGNDILTSLGTTGFHYWGEGTVTKEATCGESGTRTHTCPDCSEIITEEIPATGNHTYKTTITKATLTANGTLKEICEVCADVRISSIYYPKTFKLSATSYTYNGNVKKPVITVIDSNGNTIASSNYTVIYKKNKNVGKASAVVTLQGNYSGSKTVNFVINPKGTSLSKVTKAKKAATVKWKKQSNKMSKSRITGYQIQLATNSKFTKNKKTVNVKGYSKVSKKVSGLKGEKKYYVRIRTYMTVSGTNYYSPWSKVKTVTTKK